MKAKRVFISHNSQDGGFAVAIAAALQRCVDGGVFCYENTTKNSFPAEMAKEIKRCTHMVVLVGNTESDHQNNEVESFYVLQPDRSHWFVVDCRTDHAQPLPEPFSLLEGVTKFSCDQAKTTHSGLRAAREISRTFGLPWQASDGLPANPHLFDYEKRIIDFYTRMLIANNSPEADNHEKLLGGAPPEWPTVHVLKPPDGRRRINPATLQEHVGEWREPDAKILVAALSQYHDAGDIGCDRHCCQLLNGFCFPEAGPRKEHIFPQAGRSLNVGILVSGGIAPGINAVIDGITQRHFLYAKRNQYTVRVEGLLNGFHAFDQRTDSSIRLFPDAENGAPSAAIITADYADYGGSILGTSRVDSLIDPMTRISELENIVAQAYGWPLDILYVIGGDGSMKAAHAIWSHAHDFAKRKGIDKPLSVVGIPKTMDNDILWVWQSFGFLSAVEKAREVIQDLHTEVSSNPRLCVAQLFGSDSGFVVSHAVLATRTGTCDAALIPEVPFTMRKLAQFIMCRMATKAPRRSGRIPSALVVMAETAIPVDAMDFIDDPDVALIEKEKNALRNFQKLRDKDRRIQGQTDEWLRSGGLKIVSRGLEKLIKGGEIHVNGDFDMPDWSLLRVFTNEPKHLLRAIPPSCNDIIIGHRLGTLAVDNALAGYTDFMLSQWLTEYVLVPLGLVVLGRKRIPRKGVFWRSVKSKTGQQSLSE